MNYELKQIDGKVFIEISGGNLGKEVVSRPATADEIALHSPKASPFIAAQAAIDAGTAEVEVIDPPRAHEILEAKKPAQKPHAKKK